MPIKIQCEHCQSSLTVNDKMAGKQGKCPKCGEVLQIPAAGGDELNLESDPLEAAGQGADAGGGGWGAGARSPLDDLLDEAGVRAASTGPVCPSCSADLEPDSVMCVECGFSFAAGRQIKTQVGYDNEAQLAGMSENEKIMAKAEQEVAVAPITTDDGDFGDGADSFLIALGMLIVGVVVVGLGILTVYLMDKVTTDSDVSFIISYWISIVMILVGWIWISIVAFMENVWMGIGCLISGFCCPVYFFYYGCTRFRGLYIPFLLWNLGSLGTTVSGAVLGWE